MPLILHYANPCTNRSLPCAPLVLEGDPLAAGRVVELHEPGQGFAAGSSVSTDANLLVECFPWVELSVVQAGELRLQGEGFDLHLGPGDCVLVPQGAKVRWHHRGQLRRVFMAFPKLEASGDIPRAPIKLNFDQPLAPCSPPAASVLLTETPRAWSEVVFEAGPLRVGLWQCEAYARRQVEPSYSELMFILEGAVTLTAQDGDSYHVRAGETVIVPQGATNAWASTQTVRKVFCILS